MTLPLPTFLIIGAQKSATRWLRLNLGQHPEVFTAVRELSFFNRRFHKGLDEYRAGFEGWQGEPVVGEATPGYLMWRENPRRAAERIGRSLPDVRLIALLRNPVDRAYSAFIHHMRRGRIPLEAELLDLIRSTGGEDRFGLITGGLYAQSLEPYLATFGRRLRVFLHDEVVEDPERLYVRALEHIGASPSFVPAELGQVRFSRKPPTASRFVGERGARRSLTDAERVEIYGYFARDVDRLEQMLGRDLSAWRPG